MQTLCGLASEHVTRQSAHAHTVGCSYPNEPRHSTINDPSDKPRHLQGQAPSSMPPGKSPTRRYTLRWQRCLLVSGAVTLVLGLNIVLMNAHLELHDEEEFDEYQWQRARKSSSPSRVAAAHIPPPAPPAPPTTPCVSEASDPPVHDPVASSEAVVTIGRKLRLTVLTSTVIRMDSTFDDRASFTIVNRRLPRPTFRSAIEACELLRGTQCLVVETSRVRLEVLAPSDASPSSSAGPHVEWAPPRLTKESMRARIRMHANAESVEWWPGKPNPRQLPGTIRTLDNSNGAVELRCDALPESLKEGGKDAAHCAMGLISRDGWVLLDDTSTGRFNGASSRGGWDWAEPSDPEQVAADKAAVRSDGDARCAGWARSGECTANADFMKATCKSSCAREAERVRLDAEQASGHGRFDWYLFGAGLDFATALRDFGALSGTQPIPPRYAFGVWISRWWPYADWESDALLREFDERGVPCDVLISDMDWRMLIRPSPTQPPSTPNPGRPDP